MIKEEIKGKTLLTVKVTPRGSANKIQSIERDLFEDRVIKVMVTAIPDKGEANKAVIEVLSKHLRIPKSAFRIVAGKTSRVKIISVDSEEAGVWKKLEEIKKIREQKALAF